MNVRDVNYNDIGRVVLEVIEKMHTVSVSVLYAGNLPERKGVEWRSL